MLYGQQYLAGIGVSTVHAVLDLESYSEAGLVYDPIEEKWEVPPGAGKNKRGLKNCGLYNYWRHPTAEILSLTYNVFDGTGDHFWRPGFPNPEPLLAHIRAGKLISGWHVPFELEGWNTVAVRDFGWPPLDPNQVRCDAAKSRAQAYPSRLADAGPVLELPPHLLKDKKGEELIKKLTMPRNPTKTNRALRWTRATAIEEFEQFDAYNVQDGITEAAISLRVKDLSPRELRIWQFSERCNRRGMMIDTVGMHNCIRIVEQCMERGNSELHFITGGKVPTYSSVKKIEDWANTQGTYLRGLDEDQLELELAKPHPANVLRVLKIRQMLSFGSVKKLFAMRNQVNPDGRLRDQYIYHGAHTSLWNGQHVQPANLYKGKLHKPEEVETALAVIASGSLEYVEALYGDALETIADCLRSMIVAAPGHDLIAADYNAIQAVITACLANEEWRIAVFRARGDIYLAMASRLTGKPVEFYIEHRKRTGEHHEDRQLGKLAVLSADFGAWIGGWKRFGAEKYGDDKWIKQTILKTRDAQPMVGELWGGQVRNKFQHDECPELYGLEGAAIRAILEPGKCFGYRGIRYMVHGRDLYCQPPTNGDPLVYHDIDLAPSKRDYARPYEMEMTYAGWSSTPSKGGGWVRQKLYGGVQTQNVVSKCAREYQADSLCTLDETGIYPIVMHTHDEAVAEVRKDQGVGSTEHYLSIVNTPPAWAVHFDGTYKGQYWPVRAPGAERTFRFGKWD